MGYFSFEEADELGAGRVRWGGEGGFQRDGGGGGGGGGLDIYRIPLSGHPLRLNGHPFGLIGHPFRLSGHPLAFYD